MAQQPHERYSPRSRRGIVHDIRFGLAAFLILTGLTLIAFPMSRPAMVETPLGPIRPDLLILVLAAAGFAATGPNALRGLRRIYHDLTNRLFVDAPVRVTEPFVIDGDTIDDRRTGVRYRLANIDAPETGNGARCASERRIGEWATEVAAKLIAAAERVEVRRTIRTDRWGRRVAFVLVDGEDLGETLVRRGLAAPWRGQRAKWCGPRGSLSELARRRGLKNTCLVCMRAPTR